MKDCQSIINLSIQEKINFFCMDTSGNRSKFTFLMCHYHEILNEIENYSLKYKLSDLPFKEQCYLFAHEIKEPPVNIDGHPLIYKNFSKGYSKQSFIIRKIPNILEELNYIFNSNSQIGGRISQILLSNDYIQHKKLLEEITSFADMLFPKLRHRIWLYQNNINNIPKFRCRYDKIEVKCIFKPAYFNDVFDHHPIRPVIDDLNVVNSIDNSVSKLDPWHHNLREIDIKEGIMVCYHYRIISQENNQKKLEQNYWYIQKGYTCDDLMSSDHPEIVDFTLKKKLISND